MAVHVQRDGDITYMFKSLVDQKNHLLSAMIVKDGEEYAAYFGSEGMYDFERMKLSAGMKLQKVTLDKDEAYNLCYEYVKSLNEWQDKPVY